MGCSHSNVIETEFRKGLKSYYKGQIKSTNKKNSGIQEDEEPQEHEETDNRNMIKVINNINSVKTINNSNINGNNDEEVKQLRASKTSNNTNNNKSNNKDEYSSKELVKLNSNRTQNLELVNLSSSNRNNREKISTNSNPRKTSNFNRNTNNSVNFNTNNIKNDNTNSISNFTKSNKSISNSDWSNHKKVIVEFLSELIIKYNLNLIIDIESINELKHLPYNDFYVSNKKQIRFIRNNNNINSNSSKSNDLLLNWNTHPYSLFKAETETYFNSNINYKKYFNNTIFSETYVSIYKNESFYFDFNLKTADNDYLDYRVNYKNRDDEDDSITSNYVFFVFNINDFISILVIKRFFEYLKRNNNSKNNIKFIPIVADLVKDSKDVTRLTKILKLLDFSISNSDIEKLTCYVFEKPKSKDKLQSEYIKLFRIEEINGEISTDSSPFDIASELNNNEDIYYKTIMRTYSDNYSKYYVVNKEHTVVDIGNASNFVIENVINCLKINNNNNNNNNSLDLSYCKLKESVISIINNVNNKDDLTNLNNIITITTSKERLYDPKTKALINTTTTAPRISYISNSNNNSNNEETNKQFSYYQQLLALFKTKLIPTFSNFISTNYYNQSIAGIKKQVYYFTVKKQIKLNYKIEYKITRKYHRNLSYKATKTTSLDLLFKLNPSNIDISKEDLSKQMNILLVLANQPKLDYIKFLPDTIIETKFDSKEALKPKICLIFYTSDNEEMNNYLEDLLKDVLENLETEEFKGKFHEIFFRRKDTEDCMNLENNEKDIPEILNTYGKKVVGLPKKLGIINLQNLCPDFALVLTDKKNNIVYSDYGLDLDIEATLSNIINDDDGDSKNKDLVVYNKTSFCDKSKAKEIIKQTNKIVKFIGEKLEEEKIFHKPYLEFSYRKTHSINSSNISYSKSNTKDSNDTIYYSHFTFTLTLKHLNDDIVLTKEFKQYKKQLLKEYKGKLIIDVSTETTAILEDEENPSKIKYSQKCSNCNSRELNIRNAFYFDNTTTSFYCLECEEKMNNQEEMITHANNLIYIQSESNYKAAYLLNELFTYNYDKYNLSERNLEPEDCINCVICHTKLEKDSVVWISLIHLYNDLNNSENFIFCNKKCFKAINAYNTYCKEILRLERNDQNDNCLNSSKKLEMNKATSNLSRSGKEKKSSLSITNIGFVVDDSNNENALDLFFNKEEKIRIKFNCFDLRNMVLRKVILPITGY